MVDYENNSKTHNNLLDLKEVENVFNKAISNNYLVELRVEDEPRMDIDSILETKITEATIDEENKCLHISAQGLKLIFKYESYDMGTESSSHSKFYFKSNGVTLTVTVFM